MQTLKHEAAYYQTAKFRWRQRIGFGISDYACNLAYLLANTYLLFYYTNCAGISAGAAGVMFVITKFIGAVTDYLVGALCDHTDTKMGRYRPWMLAGVPILAIGMILLFSVPVDWNETGKLAWAYITYIIFSLGYTLVNIPMAPIVSTLSASPTERTNIATARMIFANLGSLTSSLFVLPMVYYFAGSSDATGAALARGYRNTNIVLGIIVIIIICICVFSVVEINPPTETGEKTSFLQDIKNAFKSKYFNLTLLLVFFLFLAYLGMYGAIQYYYTYIIGDVNLMSIAMSLLTILAIPAVLLAAYLNGKGVAKVKLMQIGAVIDVIGYLVLFITSDGMIATIALAFVGFGFGFRLGMYYSMLTDVFDYTEWKCGKSLAGTQTAVTGFVNKLASAFSSAIISSLLVWGSYDAEAMDAVVAAGESLTTNFSSALTSINLAFGGLALVSTIIAIIVMIPYDLDKRYPAIRADLDKRKIKV